MNFIKKIVDGKVDEDVHVQFMKFSKGEFRDRAVIKAKRSGGKYTVNTTAEFSNELVRDVAEILGSERTNITGAIVSTSDLKEKIDFKEIKQFQGVKRYLIDREMSGDEIVSLLNEFPKTFFALSFSAGDTVLKIKPKAPKSGKPSTKGEETPNPDFCKLVTTNEKLGKSFVYEKPDFKSALLKHTFFIDSIIIPDSLKDEKDFAVVREKSLRQGRILREGEIDGVAVKKEIAFKA